MVQHPLSLPADRQLLSRFLEHVRVDSATPPRQLLARLAEAFSHLPYENLSKIIRFKQSGSVVAAREDPAEIIEGHITGGTGGTCFSLTATLLHLVRSLGFAAEPILADRGYGPNTHCALLVHIDHHPHLLDPGFLIVDPIPLSGAEQIVKTRFNELVLVPDPTHRKLDLFTVEKNGRRYRLTFKTEPADVSEFLRAWDASFSWEMMHYPVVTRVVDQQQIYLRGQYEQIRNLGAVQLREIPPTELAHTISSQFGIQLPIVQQALAILRQQGDRLTRAQP